MDHRLSWDGAPVELEVELDLTSLGPSSTRAAYRAAVALKGLWRLAARLVAIEVRPSPARSSGASSEARGVAGTGEGARTPHARTSGSNRRPGRRQRPHLELAPWPIAQSRRDGAPLEQGEAALDGQREQGHQDRPAHEHPVVAQGKTIDNET